MIFVDASAIVAILAREHEADLLANALEAAPEAVTSAVAVFEAVLGLARKRRGLAEARQDVEDLLVAARIKVVPITEREGAMALDAAARFGKRRGHPAQLNMGDCFAYAAAKSRGASMLFVGEDFRRTDIAAARAFR